MVAFLGLQRLSRQLLVDFTTILLPLIFVRKTSGFLKLKSGLKKINLQN
jgi:hypothetical protein